MMIHHLKENLKLSKQLKFNTNSQGKKHLFYKWREGGGTRSLNGLLMIFLMNNSLKGRDIEWWKLHNFV